MSEQKSESLLDDYAQAAPAIPAEYNMARLKLMTGASRGFSLACGVPACRSLQLNQPSALPYGMLRGFEQAHDTQARRAAGQRRARFFNGGEEFLRDVA